MILPFLKRLFCFAAALSISAQLCGQKLHSLQHPLKPSATITINSFDWLLGDSIQTVVAKMNITNNNHLPVQSVSVVVAAEDSNKTMLQSGQMRTLKLSISNDTIPPQSTGDIYFNRVFVNPKIYKLILKQVRVQFENGSVEMLDKQNF